MLGRQVEYEEVIRFISLSSWFTNAGSILAKDVHQVQILHCLNPYTFPLKPAGLQAVSVTTEFACKLLLH